jgi:hypothetical protein
MKANTFQIKNFKVDWENSMYTYEVHLPKTRKIKSVNASINFNLNENE